MSVDMIGLGSLNYDYFFMVDSIAQGNQQQIIIENYSSPGGSAANTIYGLAKLGVRTGFLSTVGADPEGEKIVSQMRNIGIDTKMVKTIASEISSKVYVFVDKDGERAMYSLLGASGNFLATNNDIDNIKASKYVIISAIPGDKQLEQLKEIVKKIHDKTHIVFMPGAIYSRFGYSKLQDILTRTYLLILNSRELRTLSNRNTKEGMKWLLENGSNMIAVTLGDDGCYICDSESSHKIPTPELPKDQVIDSTGSGDAFAAGLLFGLLQQKSIAKAALLGNLSARFCIQGLGARANLPNKRFLDLEFEKYSKVVIDG